MKVTVSCIRDFDIDRPIPDGWEMDSNEALCLKPPWSFCLHRHIAYYKPETMEITLRCRLKRHTIDADECIICQRQKEKVTPPQTPADLSIESQPKKISLKELQTMRPMIVDATVRDTDEKFEEISVEKMPEDMPEDMRRELERLQNLLTKTRLEQYGARVENDGTIVYDKKDRWEPPRDLPGYLRDDNDPWRFKPLWPTCKYRRMKFLRGTKCGCLRIRMDCSYEKKEVKERKLNYTQCQNCLNRET